MKSKPQHQGNQITSNGQYLVGIDVGGTFTDAVSYDTGRKRFRFAKLPTSIKPEESVISSIEQLAIVPSLTKFLVHATTLATNALLTHTGLAETALVTNYGFRDVIEIGRQRRPELYNLMTRRPVPLVPRQHRFTVRCRILADGSESEPLNKRDARTVARKIMELHFDSVAVCFVNSYLDDRHEREMLSVLRQAGYSGFVSLSSEVDREYREYERMSTTVVNSVLSSSTSSYLLGLRRMLFRKNISSPLYVMTSDGCVDTLEHIIVRPTRILESGPAAGVIASRNLAKRLGLHKVITFDMGGTTAKAGAIIDFEPDVIHEFEAAGKTHSGRSIRGSGYPVRGPFIDLAEISSGGGTIAWADEGSALRIGPRSAGSNPGPACYGLGGKDPTVTDANLILGRLNKYLLGGEMILHHDKAVRAIRTLARRVSLDQLSCAQGVIQLANSMMAKAISIVSVERGRDPRDFTMIAFGGAGPLHCCDLAEELGMKRIIVPSHAGLFSAYGLITADIARTFNLPVMSTGLDLEGRFAELERIADGEMKRDGFSRYSLFRYVEARYEGQSHELTLRYKRGNLRSSFDRAHRKLYGYYTKDKVEIVNIKLKAVVSGISIDAPEARNSSRRRQGSRMAWIGGGWRKTEVFSRDSIDSHSSGKGPCIIEDYDSTLVINPSWSWQNDETHVVITR